MSSPVPPHAFDTNGPRARRGRLRRLVSLPARVWHLSWTDRWLYAEAWVCLGAGRLAVVLLPFRWISARLGHTGEETGPEEDRASVRVARRVGSVVLSAGRYAPWRGNCLAQALAAQRMLRRRHIPSTLYLGVVKEGDHQLRAHAWLRCGSEVITGRRGHKRFARVMSYAWPGAATPPSTDWRIRRENVPSA